MSMCNFCLLRDIRRQAKNDGMKVTVLGDAVWGMGGRNVYVHPPHIDVAAIEGGEDGGAQEIFQGMDEAHSRQVQVLKSKCWFRKSPSGSQGLGGDFFV